jgi:hypothetical protein
MGLELTRGGKELYAEATPRGSMQGYISTYPKADTSKMKIDLGVPISDGSSISVVKGRLRNEVRRLIDESGPFSIQPREGWRDGFLASPEWHDEIVMRIDLVSPKGIPDWLVGANEMKVSCTWRALLDPVAAKVQLEIIEQMLELERLRRVVLAKRREINEAEMLIRHSESEFPAMEQNIEKLLAAVSANPVSLAS